MIETAWLTAWLAYVHHDKHIAPAPGPCRNDRLIIWDPLQNLFVGRPGLVMAHKNCAGDFRRISRETWQKFKEFYPESGPSITMEFFAIMNNGEETNIGRHFTVLDPPPAPVVTISKTHKKKAMALAAKQEEERAKVEAAAAAAKIKAELAKKPPSHVYAADDEDESKADDDVSARESSISSSFSTVLNDPRVVSNLPNQPRNPVAEQFAQRARDAAMEDAARASERHSLASQQRNARHGESFSSLPAQQSAPTTNSVSIVTSSAPSHFPRLCVALAVTILICDCTSRTK